jgi:hypothetical protein
MEEPIGGQIFGGSRQATPEEIPPSRKAKGSDEAARLELDHRITLYQFHVGSYIRGIAFFLAINAVLFKFALDDKVQRTLYSIIALLCCLAVLVPLVFGALHIRVMNDDFKRLAEATGTKAILVSPFTMLTIATAAFWLIIFGSWVFMFFR